MNLTEFRSTLEYTLGAVNDDLNAMGFDPVPPQLIEAQVNLETGGTFDETLVDPYSGAVGLGQITEGGLEYGWYKQNIDPTVEPSDLTNPVTNLRIASYGMAYRKELGEIEKEAGGMGAWADWFMAAAGYLGGANNAGFNTKADAYGTRGEDYVRRVRQYIQQTWGAKAAEDIDLLGEGAAEIQGDDWLSETAPISFDPTEPGARDKAEERSILQRLFDGYGSGNLDTQDEGRDTSIGGQIREALSSFVVDLIGPALPRIGAAVAGLALFGIGAVVLLKGGQLG